jgi:hypothetical protein
MEIERSAGQAEQLEFYDVARVYRFDLAHRILNEMIGFADNLRPWLDSRYHRTGCRGNSGGAACSKKAGASNGECFQ